MGLSVLYYSQINAGEVVECSEERTFIAEHRMGGSDGQCVAQQGACKEVQGKGVVMSRRFFKGHILCAISGVFRCRCCKYKKIDYFNT